ncbi:enoyl-CoA hydratase [Rhodococcus sp. 06-156-3C]|uniref:enoyl-CoA hydratase/isomerase family protein n=1 Tax=Nocardiaceae TaxID=85025 RepID=UPI00052308A2|nr:MULTISPECIES: enoyl-CoA hydratase-related protein [Rhodococcus]OZD13088.1 enoyl-CoA hydratase [Rhodococcus sp. 06-156-4a]OZD17957.1 enoyl-CoA hydratase [Rhodococcus sp. 06-156-3C]OZD20681.1 enoyl-CoA hydratase [Rhodococcus sp. 06-156-4C]OZD30600.1 enoyl-CoA hydratase [Rhodococcus sp. 06-156-3b]OZD32627.1 enoyl-CoA hydratase [Rhodococcus sp. 06-156-3]
MTATASGSHVTIDGSVLRIVISTAERGTSLSPDGIQEGAAALKRLDPAVRAVLLVGDGANFCSGGDVRAFASAPDRGAFVSEMARDLHAFVRAVVASPVPVVAAVQGWAAGAGLSVVLHADIALGDSSTKLRPAYPGIGFTPDGGMSWLLPRIVGVARAREILLTDSVLAADEAVKLGLLSRLVPLGEVRDEAARVAESFAGGPVSTYRRIRQLLAGSPDRSLTDHLDAEAAAISAAAVSPAGIEGVDAFVAKRPAAFGDLRG